jgi:Mn2+/Fe2+ NRAMP family transporter
VITGFAGNEAGGVTTYSSVGAQFGYSLLWLLLVASIGLGVIQEMCSRMGLVTGQGLSDLIRERFGVRWTILAMVVLIIANGTNVVAEYAGIAASVELLGIPRIISVPLAALAVWTLVVFFSYRFVERVLFVLVLAFLAYPISVFILKPGLAGRDGGVHPLDPDEPVGTCLRARARRNDDHPVSPLLHAGLGGGQRSRPPVDDVRARRRVPRRGARRDSLRSSSSS